MESTDTLKNTRSQASLDFLNEAAQKLQGSLDTLAEATQKIQSKLEQVQALRDKEAYYVQHPQEIRPPAHAAEIATVRYGDDWDQGWERQRGRQRDEEPARTRTPGRAW